MAQLIEQFAALKAFENPDIRYLCARIADLETFVKEQESDSWLKKQLAARDQYLHSLVRLWPFRKKAPQWWAFDHQVFLPIGLQGRHVKILRTFWLDLGPVRPSGAPMAKVELRPVPAFRRAVAARR